LLFRRDEVQAILFEPQSKSTREAFTQIRGHYLHADYSIRGARIRNFLTSIRPFPPIPYRLHRAPTPARHANPESYVKNH
jgi:hypothetical protein